MMVMKFVMANDQVHCRLELGLTIVGRIVDSAVGINITTRKISTARNFIVVIDQIE